MADCEKYQELISLYVDRGISDKEKAELLAHMETCEDCAELLSTYAEISRIMADDVEPPEELLTGVMAEVREINSQRSVPKNRSRRAAVRWLAIAACAAIILIPASRLLFGGYGAKSDSAASTTESIEVRDSVSADTATASSADASDDSAYSGSTESVESDMTTSPNADSNSGSSSGSAGKDDSLYVIPGSNLDAGSFGVADMAEDFYAVVYADSCPEELMDDPSRLVYGFSDGTEAVVITLDELSAYTGGEYNVEYYNTESADALLVYTP